MELDGMALFVDTVRAGSITGAARRRGVPKSTLSRQLRRFEERLGVRLLERSTRRLDLTEAGELLYREAAPFLEELEEIQSAVRAYQRQPKGRLTIQVPQELFAAQMGELVSEFLQLYPEISLRCTHYSGFVPAPSPEFDLQLVLHDTDLPASEWIARPLLSIPQSLVVAPGYEGALPDTVAELGRCSLILHAGEPTWSFRIGDGIVAVPVAGRLILNSPDMRLHAAIRGQGIARLARYVAVPALRRGALRELALDGRPVAEQLTALYRSRRMPLKTRLFLEHFQEHISRFYSEI